MMITNEPVFNEGKHHITERIFAREKVHESRILFPIEKHHKLLEIGKKCTQIVEAETRPDMISVLKEIKEILKVNEEEVGMMKIEAKAKEERKENVVSTLLASRSKENIEKIVDTFKYSSSHRVLWKPQPQDKKKKIWSCLIEGKVKFNQLNLDENDEYKNEVLMMHITDEFARLSEVFYFLFVLTK